MTQYIVMNKAKTTYRRINTEEIHRALDHNNMFISDLRKIEILSEKINCEKRGCNIANETIFIHENRHDLLTFRRLNNTNNKAFLSCKRPGESSNNTQIELPTAAFITLPRWCSLSNSEFRIAEIEDRGTLLQPHKQLTFNIEEFSPKVEETESERKLNALQKASQELTMELHGKNEELKRSIMRTRNEVIELRRHAIIISGALGTCTILVIILVIIALCCICHTWAKINFYHR